VTIIVTWRDVNGMTTAAISRLKARLSEYLSRVKEGEEVVVTDRGRPIAKLIPYTLEGDEAERRLELARRGIIKLGRGPVSKKFLETPKVKDPEGLALKYLLEERESGR
jgi:prevent-host-death family protein